MVLPDDLRFESAEGVGAVQIVRREEGGRQEEGEVLYWRGRQGSSALRGQRGSRESKTVKLL